MTQDQFVMLFIVGCAVLALVAIALLLLLRGAEDHHIAFRIGGLRQNAVVAAAPVHAPRISVFLFSLMRDLGNALRERLLSAHDAEVLARTLAASGFEPLKAMPIFIGAKVLCLISVPALVYLGLLLLGYPGIQQLVGLGASLAVGMMLPNWVMAAVRRPYQQALRRGIPDALDLLVVCAQAGLGLDSSLERVAQEMKKSNRPVGVEFALFSYELRMLPDRRIALAHLAERTGQPALKRLAGTIAQTMKYGTPLTQGLRTLAAEMRTERMTQFEERAGRLPALLVLPMIVFILPCLFIILLGQPVSELMGALGGVNH